MVQDILYSSIIQPSRSSFSSPVVMVRRKDKIWRMFPNYRDLNKITIKDKFLIPNIDEILDELRGVVYFMKLNIKL
jgi:hypothetical protein